MKRRREDSEKTDGRTTTAAAPDSQSNEHTAPGSAGDLPGHASKRRRTRESASGQASALSSHDLDLSRPASHNTVASTASTSVHTLSALLDDSHENHVLGNALDDTHDGPEFLELLDSSPASASASAASADAGAGAASSASTAAQGPKVTGFKSVQAALLHVVQPSTRELILGAVSEELAASSIMAWREREARTNRSITPLAFAAVQRGGLQQIKASAAASDRDASDAVNEGMFSILTDWLVDVNQVFKLQEQTLHLAVRFLVRCLSAASIERSNFQLLGVTALWIASKLEDVYPPPLDEIVNVSNCLYSEEMTETMETRILAMLQFELADVTALQYLPLYLAAAGLTAHGPVDDINRYSNKPAFAFTSTVASYAYYLLDVALMSFACQVHRPSMLAAAAVLLALGVCELPSTPSLERVKRMPGLWTPALEAVSGWRYVELVPCARVLLAAQRKFGESPQHRWQQQQQPAQQRKPHLVAVLRKHYGTGPKKDGVPSHAAEYTVACHLEDALNLQ